MACSSQASTQGNVLQSETKQLSRPTYPKLQQHMVKNVLDLVKKGDIDALKLELEVILPQVQA